MRFLSIGVFTIFCAFFRHSLTFLQKRESWLGSEIACDMMMSIKSIGKRNFYDCKL